MAGAQRPAGSACPRCWAARCACIAAPCIGRCEQAPAVVVGQNPVPQRQRCRACVATVAGRGTSRTCPKVSSTSPPTGPTAATRCSRNASPASATSSRSSRRWKTPACAAWAAPVSRPGASGASCATKPAPRLMAVNIDEGEPGTFKDRVYLERDPHRFLEGMLIAAWAVGIETHLRLPARRIPRLPRACWKPSWPSCAPTRRWPACREIDAAPRRRRLHLRRRVGDDRIDRRQARHAAAAPAVRGAGRACSAGRRWNTTSRRCTGCATSSRRAAPGSPRHGRNGRKGLRSFSVSGRVKSPGVKLAPAGITIQELIDEYCGGMLDGHELLRLPAGRRVGRHPAGLDERHPARLRHAAALRLLHRLGRGDRAVRPGHRGRRGAQPDALLRSTSPAASARPAASAPPRRSR